MKKSHHTFNALSAAVAAAVITGLSASVASAREPCNGFGECKALVEINSTDGDIGFHVLMDGDDLIKARINDPNGFRIFTLDVFRDLRQQTITEIFFESAEPLCFDPLTDEDPENDEEDFVTLEDFVNRWQQGEYLFIGRDAALERPLGRTDLTFDLPAAPTNLMFDDVTGVISWTAGNDLGECADSAALDDLVTQGLLPQHPQDVPVAVWEAVFEPDVEPDHPSNGLKYTIRVPGNIAVQAVTVPADYLASLPADTPAKIEVGAIGDGDNATFTEVADICINEVAGCE